MKKFAPTLLLVLFLGNYAFTQNALPVINSCNLIFNEVDSTFQLSYEFDDADSESFNVDLLVSEDGGISFDYLLSDLSGDIGMDLDKEGPKQIIGKYGKSDVTNVVLRLVISDQEEIDVQTIVNSVDSNFVKEYLQNIEGIRHRVTGLPHLLDTREYVISHLQENQLDTSSYYFNFNSFQARNIFGRSNGLKYQQREYLVGGHYDTVANAPGADDNGTAVAAMMEIARVFEPYQFAKSIRYVSWDLEEEGLKGSINYVATEITPEQEILGYLNFEMIGYYDETPNSQTLPFGFDFIFPDAYQEILDNDFRGDFLTNVGNEDSSSEMAADFEEIAGMYVPELSVISIISPGNGGQVPDLLRSDHAPFWNQNIPSVMLTDAADFRNPYYHTPNDVMDSLDMNFLTNNIKASVAYLAEKAEVLHAATKDIEIDSLITSTEIYFSENSFVLYPNPANEIISIEFDQEISTENFKLQIFDFAGREVDQRIIKANKQNRFVLRTEHLPIGQYQMRIETDLGHHLQSFQIQR